MKALVLAGGLGTRLKARFGDLPKPLVPLGGRPFLEHQLASLAGHGIVDIVLCVGHGAEEMRAALGDGGSLGVRLAYSIESEPLGTGGALALAAAHADRPLLVVNGDTLAPCDPWALERARWERGAVGAVALFQVEDASRRGRVECDPGGQLSRFVEKDPAHRGPAWVNGGLYAFHPALWGWLPAGASSLERDVLPRLAASALLVGLQVPGAFHDIGTPEDWEKAERRFAGQGGGGGAA